MALEPSYVQRTINVDNKKNLKKTEGRGVLLLFDNWPFRVRKRVSSDDLMSVKNTPGTPKDSAKGPRYLSTSSPMNKNVGLLLRCLAGYIPSETIPVAKAECD